MTRRSFLLGLALAVWANLWPTYSSLIVRSSRGDFAHLSVAFLLPFLFLLLVNLPFEARGRGLTSSELLTICCIGMVAACMHGEWLSGYFLGVLTAPAYFASPQNFWADRVLSYLPDWAYLSNHASAVGFYEGLPPNYPTPWEQWVPLLLIWSTFLGALLTANFCLVTLLRKQWMDNERLAFPIASVLLELTGVSGSQGTLNTLIRSRLFQIGFFFIFGIFLWNIGTWFIISLPPLQIVTRINILLGRGIPPLWFVFQPMTVAFGYFTKSDVLFSLWLFHLLAVLQVGVFNRLGLDFGASDQWCSINPAIGWQSFGGLIVFVAWGLWTARDHLKAIFRKAWTGKGGPDHSGELISYRTAFWLFVGCGIYMVLFLYSTGMGLASLMTFWFATAVLYLGLARIIVESGLIFLRGPITAQAFTWHVLGYSGLGSVGAAAMGLTFTILCDAKTFGITTLAHIPRLSQAMEPRKRRVLVPAVLIGSLLGATAVIGFILHEGYHVVGSYNFGAVSFNGSNDGAVGIWRITSNRIGAAALPTDWNRLRFLGIGAVFTGILYALRFRYPTFPVHPIGFAISSSGPMRSSFSSIFITWAIKTSILRVGGLETYRKGAPLFLGMLTGHLAGIALGLVVDIIWFPGNGHQLNRW